MASVETKKCGIYNIIGVKGEKQGFVKPLTLIELKKDEHIADTLISRIQIIKGVYAETYICNITDAFLISTRKLPVFSTIVKIDRPLRTMPILKLYLYFTITDEINSSRELLENKLNGNYSIESIIDNTSNIVDPSLKRYPGDEQMLNKLLNFLKEEEMIELIKELVEVEDEKLREKYKIEYDDYCTIPKATISLKDYVKK